MRAMLLIEPGRFGPEDRPRPAPGAAELLIQTEACGLCASELDVFLGRNPWQQYPALLGHEGVGRVIATGAEASGWQVGDLASVAIGGGCYADAFTVKSDEALHVPDDLAPHLALAEPLSCAINSLMEIAPPPDSRIVVLGAGFMGLALTQLLRDTSPQWLLVAARRADAQALARGLGATEACSTDQVQQRVWELTGGEGADIVVEATGSEQMLAISASLLRPEGTLAIVGYHQGAGRQVPIHEWNWKALSIANCHFRSRARMVDGARRGLALATRGTLDIARLVTHQFPLSDIQRA
ncbi:MAG TPA: zinc-binding dehydrogenase, partial [Chloroflexota bacterium]|nr:zinc-binding dehydrogenase [Chloroflexota bacterium]